jgi:hypothetical protein
VYHLFFFLAIIMLLTTTFFHNVPFGKVTMYEQRAIRERERERERPIEDDDGGGNTTSSGFCSQRRQCPSSLLCRTLKQEPKDDPKKFRLRSSLLEASFWNRRL